MAQALKGTSLIRQVLLRDTCKALLRGATQALCFAVRTFSGEASFILLVAEGLMELDLRLDTCTICKQAPRTSMACLAE